MKSRIFMYLFIFSLLLVVFQYVNSKNILEDYEDKLEKKIQKQTELERQILNLEDQIFDLKEFTIDENEGALTYLEDAGYDTSKLIPAIKEGLYNMNNYNGDDHPIVPYVSMTEGKILIDKIRLLNHRWIIANFSDGKHWGEIFVTYEVDNEGNLKYKLVEYFMYPTS
ncbi:hydrolase [Ichthyenterobacterium sp. W332]|uniref:Hydrolase n=1 Tax=Microcosmobacter mediterraneus TaxID=3075607 RepID=A0ABU2YLX3_9FLAO|nr:hydrolase [Ichthyenterobacterium sp. W332]MDT0558704.1 hydrolase [Ichthyenterobacterium sp. W332]